MTVAGFRRRDDLPRAVRDLDPIELGRTVDARYLQRMGCVLWAAAGPGLGRLAGRLADADVIVARNLEMLVVGDRLRRRLGGRVPLVYECLDIHRLLAGPGLGGVALRALERRLSRRCARLLTSSPDFVRHHFAPSGIRTPVELLENRVLLDGAPAPAPVARPPGPPWRIGWFGALRCRRSLDLLSSLARERGGEVEVVVRGQPTRAVFPEFAAEVAAMPHLSFGGAYRYPADLPSLYGSVHFVWAVDYFEEGFNSAWLLPNRLYEGGLYGAVPLALEGTAVARFLRERGIGYLLDSDVLGSLSALFDRMTPAEYRLRAEGLAALPAATWACGREDCEALVSRLADPQAMAPGLRAAA